MNVTLGIRFQKIRWIWDADVRGYFDSIDHRWMVKFMEHRISDKHMHQSTAEQARWLSLVVRGYYQYYAIPGNWNALGTFRTQVTRMWYKTLRRRSQKSRLNWERMTKIADAVLPPARILHPRPEQRFDAMI